jgi:dUTP pyrophosphatase
MTKTLYKKLNDKAIAPSRGTRYAAGYDLSSVENYTLQPMERKLFKTGIAIAIPLEFAVYGRIAPRSGLALKDGIDVMAGVVDSDYRGEICVLLINLGASPKQISIGDKIAQLIFERPYSVDFEETDTLPATERGESGFGSTGK